MDPTTGGNRVNDDVYVDLTDKQSRSKFHKKLSKKFCKRVCKNRTENENLEIKRSFDEEWIEAD